MKSILAIINTYYQMIATIQLKMTLWKGDMVSIIITDQSKGSKDVSDKLKTHNLFRNIYFEETKELCALDKPLTGKICNFKYVLVGIEKYKYIWSSDYDEFVYYNADVFTYSLFAKLIKNNPQMHCSRYEEGMFSYNAGSYLKNSKLKYADKIREVFRWGTLEKYTDKFYCFYPELYFGSIETIKIPQITDLKGMGDLLGEIFSIETAMTECKEKYIFFTSVYDFEGGQPIGEYDIVSQIAEIVGIDNLLIKTHPRDTRSIFEDAGFHVYKGSSVPWEAVQLNGDFSNKFFLTINSGSVISVNAMVENGAKVYFFYNCCSMENNPVALKTKEDIRHTVEIMRKQLGNVVVLDSIEQFKNQINDSK